MSIKRYDLNVHDGWMEEWHEGVYVRFKDYETLKNSHDELFKCLEIANAEQQEDWSSEYNDRLIKALVTAHKLATQ